MPFTAEQILDDAEQATGLRDWGGDTYFEDSFRSLFDAMVSSLQSDANLHQAGMRGAELRLRAMAEARLQFIADRKKWPAIAQETVSKPIFILGLPRAGSSFLLDLMSRDPGNRTAKTWEMMFPSPPPEESTYTSDPRIARCQAIYDAMGLGGEVVRSLHPFGAEQPEECHIMMELMCLGDNLPGVWRLSEYNKVRASVDLIEGYRTHRMALQNLQHRYRGERWVLKNPGHVFYLEQLLAVYPDARIIQTHRDPAKVIPSVTALLAAMRRANSDTDLREARIAQGNLKAFSTGLERAITFRSRPGIDDHFCDVHFRNLIRDPMAVVRQIYERFDLPLSHRAIANMEGWLAADSSHSAKAKFSLADFELDETQIDDAFGNYMAHYGIEAERNRV